MHRLDLPTCWLAGMDVIGSALGLLRSLASLKQDLLLFAFDGTG